MNQNSVDNSEDKLNVTEMLSDETLQNVVAYQQENGNNVPLHVLGTNKGSTLYKALKSSGMINADGTVNAAELVNAYQQRSDNQNSGLQGAVKDGIINNKTNAVRSDENGGTNADILAGRGVSTSGRSQNRVRTYGANTEIIRGKLENVHSSEKNDVNVLAAGESAWLSTRDFEPAQEVGGGLEKNFLRNIQGVKSNGYDSVGRILSPELQEKVSDTVAEDGVLKENCGVTEADSNDGSAFDLDKNAEDKNDSNSDDVNADADAQSDHYAKDDKYWKAENKHQDDSVPKGLLQKIKALFSKNSVLKTAKTAKRYAEKQAGSKATTVNGGLRLMTVILGLMIQKSKYTMTVTEMLIIEPQNYQILLKAQNCLKHIRNLKTLP